MAKRESTKIRELRMALELIRDIANKTLDELGDEGKKEKKVSVADPAFNPIKDAFTGFFEKEKNVTPYYGVKDSVAINQIILKLKKIAGDEYSTEAGVQAFKAILSNLKKTDEWIYDNVSLPLLNNKFDTLVAKIKSKKGGTYESHLQSIQERIRNG